MAGWAGSAAAVLEASAADSTAAGGAPAGTAGDGDGAVTGPITAQDGVGDGVIRIMDPPIILPGTTRTRILTHTLTLPLTRTLTPIRIQAIPTGMLPGMLPVPLFIAEQSRPLVRSPMEARFI